MNLGLTFKHRNITAVHNSRHINRHREVEGRDSGSHCDTSNLKLLVHDPSKVYLVLHLHVQSGLTERRLCPLFCNLRWQGLHCDKGEHVPNWTISKGFSPEVVYISLAKASHGWCLTSSYGRMKESCHETSKLKVRNAWWMCPPQIHPLKPGHQCDNLRRWTL